MSTKIYYGFRCQLARLGDATAVLRAEMWRNVIAFANDERVDSYEHCEAFVAAYAPCGIHVFAEPGRRYAHFSLFGLPRFCEVRRLGPLGRFSYWNNTDTRPPRVSEREWDLRRDTWARVLRADGWERRLTNIVLDDGPFGSRPLYRALHPDRKA